MTVSAEPLVTPPAAAGLEDATARLCEALARHADQHRLKRGEILVREGEPSDALHFVLSGHLSDRARGDRAIPARAARRRGVFLVVELSRGRGGVRLLRRG